MDFTLIIRGNKFIFPLSLFSLPGIEDTDTNYIEGIHRNNDQNFQSQISHRSSSKINFVPLNPWGNRRS